MPKTVVIVEDDRALREELVQILGRSDKEIGDQLQIPPETVRTHVKNICAKMPVRSRLEAVAKHRPQPVTGRPA